MVRSSPQFAKTRSRFRMGIGDRGYAWSFSPSPAGFEPAGFAKGSAHPARRSAVWPKGPAVRPARGEGPGERRFPTNPGRPNGPTVLRTVG